MIKISPSILSADFSRLGDEVRKAEAGGADLLHIDVMDGHFVPNITVGIPVIAALRRVTRLPFDVHIMVEDPGRLAAEFIRAGADILTFHYEAEPEVAGLAARIRSLGAQPGVSIRPATPPQVLFPLLDRVAMVLVMTVEPGFGGQKLIPDCLEKAAVLRRECRRRGLAVDIEVDGGITVATAADAARNGANVLVAGSAVFHAPDPAAAVREIRSAAQRAAQA